MLLDPPNHLIRKVSLNCQLPYAKQTFSLYKDTSHIIINPPTNPSSINLLKGILSHINDNLTMKTKIEYYSSFLPLLSHPTVSPSWKVLKENIHIRPIIAQKSYRECTRKSTNSQTSPQTTEQFKAAASLSPVLPELGPNPTKPQEENFFGSTQTFSFPTDQKTR